jgi:hypothetical protein
VNFDQFVIHQIPGVINPPGSTSKYFLQFSKNKFALPNPVMAIFQGGVITQDPCPNSGDILQSS